MSMFTCSILSRTRMPIYVVFLRMGWNCKQSENNKKHGKSINPSWWILQGSTVPATSTCIVHHSWCLSRLTNDFINLRGSQSLKNPLLKPADPPQLILRSSSSCRKSLVPWWTLVFFMMVLYIWLHFWHDWKDFFDHWMFCQSVGQKTFRALHSHLPQHCDSHSITLVSRLGTPGKRCRNSSICH